MCDLRGIAIHLEDFHEVGKKTWLQETIVSMVVAAPSLKLLLVNG